MARERSPWRCGPNRPGTESVASQSGSGSESVGGGKRKNGEREIKKSEETRENGVIRDFGVGI